MIKINRRTFRKLRIKENRDFLEVRKNEHELAKKRYKMEKMYRLAELNHNRFTKEELKEALKNMLNELKEDLKEGLREELKEELKKELKEELN